MPVKLRIDNNIGWIEFDQPEAKVNLLTSDALKRLDGILNELQNLPSLGAVVFLSRKKDVFLAGADIKEIETITARKEGEAKSRIGQNIFNRIEAKTSCVAEASNFSTFVSRTKRVRCIFDNPEAMLLSER